MSRCVDQACTPVDTHEMVDKERVHDPDRDYPSLTTLERCVAYLGGRLEERLHA